MIYHMRKSLLLLCCVLITYSVAAHALNQANNGNYQKLMLLMTQSLERTLNIYITALPGSSYDYQEISQIVKEPDFPYGQEYISLLARQGKIDAYKEGRNWLTTTNAIDNYMASRIRKR